MKSLPVVSCNDCGACCRHMVFPPFVPFDEADEWDIPKSLKKELRHFIRNIRPTLPESYPCCWLDLTTMKCRHHEYRPSICRDYELGGEDCLITRQEYGIE